MELLCLCYTPNCVQGRLSWLHTGFVAVRVPLPQKVEGVAKKRMSEAPKVKIDRVDKTTISNRIFLFLPTIVYQPLLYLLYVSLLLLLSELLCILRMQTIHVVVSLCGTHQLYWLLPSLCIVKGEIPAGLTLHGLLPSREPPSRGW